VTGSAWRTVRRAERPQQLEGVVYPGSVGGGGGGAGVATLSGDAVP
jgi:hypothetical protein